VDFEVAQAVFDCAVGSMNFGSGFLDDDEVHALRRFAEAIGVNPMAGTPSEYSKRILHVYEQTDYVDHWTKEKATYCKWCSLPEHDANGIHRGGMDLYGRVAD
jgi:hypothetical protein